MDVSKVVNYLVKATEKNKIHWEDTGSRFRTYLYPKGTTFWTPDPILIEIEIRSYYVLNRPVYMTHHRLFVGGEKYLLTEDGAIELNNLYQTVYKKLHDHEIKYKEYVENETLNILEKLANE